ncbi:hypothetical protein DFH09DRAFT_1245965 [Mycena vulgaris]|nr:hypothetical protein DFH09DRAFT_1245965 [Mycena vulgaris]
MCALFIGSETVPTRENIRKLSPVVVSKSRVETLINFLLNDNAFYAASGAIFSRENLDQLLGPEWEGCDTGVPCGVELCCLPVSNTSSMESYAERGNYADHPSTVVGDPAELVMDAVGYTVDERSPEDYRKMKASAVAWCLDKKSFVQMQSTSKFMSDNDPGLLTFAFPNLDPWGIGGFNEPNRTPEQYISFEKQVKNLLFQHDGAFQKDPNFAYVCWNIIQKKDVNKHVSFRTNASSQAATVGEIHEMGPLLTDLNKKWEINPRAKASNRAAKKALRTLSKLRHMAKDLKGSSGYKQCRRNEIRAMMKKLATPALFMTLNPADIIDPLLGAMAGIPPEEWAAMTDFQ